MSSGSERSDGATLDVELQSQVSEAKFRGLLESAPDAMVIANVNGCIELVNRQAELLFGYVREEMIGQPIELLVPSASRDAHGGHRARYVATPHARPMGAGLELTARRKDGSEIPVEVSLSPLRTPEGMLVTAAIRDVSERRRVEAVLRASEEQYRRLVDLSPEPTLVHRASTIVYTNSAALELFGATSADGILQSHDLWFLASSPQLSARAATLASAEQSPSRFVEQEIARADGTTLHVEVSSIDVTFQGQSAVQTVLRDITERKQLEIGRAELERHKDEFFSDVAHDLGSPVAAIRTSASVLAEVLAEDAPDRVKRLVRNIDAAADEMSHLVEDLLELARLQSGRLELWKNETDLRDLVRRAAEAIESLADARGQRVQLDLPETTVMASVDAARLNRVLRNLLANAHQYSGDGSWIGVTLTAVGAEARIDVVDDGPGVPEEDLEAIFARFYRGKGSAARSRSGSGLGLPIARGLVELHGGRLWAERRPEAGSIFHVLLPASVAGVASALA